MLVDSIANSIRGQLSNFEPAILLLLGIITVAIFARYILQPLCGFFVNRRKYAKTFLELTFPINHDRSAIATEQLYNLLYARSKQRTTLERLIGIKKVYALELVSTAKDGIRFIVVVPQGEAEIMRRSLLSYVPGLKIKEIADYLDDVSKSVRCIELKLSADFVLPLKSHIELDEYDPLSHLTGHMTKLGAEELIAFQIVATPVLPSIHRSALRRIRQLRSSIYREQNLSTVLAGRSSHGIFLVFESVVRFIVSLPALLFDPGSKSIPVLQQEDKRVRKSANPYEAELAETIKRKIDQQLFETSLRLLIVGPIADARKRSKELLAALQPFATARQALVPKIASSSPKVRFKQFLNRRLSANPLSANPILASSEIAALYHLPHAHTSRTEDLIKLKSQELPAPLALKNREELDVVFGRNHYGNRFTPVGLTDDERSRHMYLIGQTGSGKSTAIYHMAAGDIAKGRGLAVVDPHGDLAEDLLAAVPEERINEVIYFNPFDIKYPVGINLLELPKDLEEDELELEQELACESVISIFRRVFNKDEHVDAHRIEYILRNTIHTAFTVEDATIFTVYELLNNPKFQKQVVSKIQDDNLRLFWKNEFGKAGDYQVVKMVSGVTAKIGRMLFSPIAKRILEQPKSTINFEDILNNEKVLICNMAEGKLGEDTSQLLGTIIIAKVHQAALRRSRKEASSRKPFYLFIDEFQNFATSSFTKLLSGGRKFGLRITIAEQSTAQQADRRIVDVILANTGVVVCFRTASPVDEDLMLSQFAPLVKEGDIANLPRHRFFMRLAAIEAEDPFSGETIPVSTDRNQAKIVRLIEASRKNYAIEYQKPEPKTVPEVIKKSSKATPALPEEPPVSANEALKTI